MAVLAFDAAALAHLVPEIDVGFGIADVARPERVVVAAHQFVAIILQRRMGAFVHRQDVPVHVVDDHADGAIHRREKRIGRRRCLGAGC